MASQVRVKYHVEGNKGERRATWTEHRPKLKIYTTLGFIVHIVRFRQRLGF